MLGASRLRIRPSGCVLHVKGKFERYQEKSRFCLSVFENAFFCPQARGALTFWSVFDSKIDFKPLFLATDAFFACFNGYKFNKYLVKKRNSAIITAVKK